MRAAIVEDGIVKNIIEIDSEFESAVLTGDIPVQIGDGYDGSDFYRDGAKLEERVGLNATTKTAEELLDDCLKALSELGVTLHEITPLKIQNPSIITQAMQIRMAIQELGRSVEDVTVYKHPILFEEWRTNKSYTKKDICKYDGVLYRCLQDHESKADWTPPVANSLWVKISDPAIEWPEWNQPTGATDAYPKDSKVSHKSKHWKSDVDNNVWEPGVYGWSEIESIPTDEEKNQNEAN